MTVPVYTEGFYLSDWLKEESEDYDRYSRDDVVVAAGQNLLGGTVLGAVTLGQAVASAVAGTGNGTVSGVTAGAYALPGLYTFTATGPTTFAVTGPKGESLTNLTVGTPYVQDQVHASVTAGSTAFVAGDHFTITIPAGTDRVSALNPSASDGTQTAIGILIHRTDATSGDKKGAAIVRRAQVVDRGALVWPVGITDDQKATAISQLQSRGILFRQGA